MADRPINPAEDVPPKRAGAPADAGTHAPPPQTPAAPNTSPGKPLNAEDMAELAAVRRIQAGDQRAWNELLDRYPDRLFGVCLRMLGTSPLARQIAADLTQQALLRIIKGIGSYDGTAKVSTWMIRVTMNVVLTHLRAAKLRGHLSLDHLRGRSAGGRVGASGGGADSTIGIQIDSRSSASGGSGRNKPEQTGGAGVEQDEERRRVADALAELEPEQRAMLVLRDVRGLEYEHIAEVLGVPLGTVKSRIFRARAALRAVLEATDGPDRPSGSSQR